MTAVALAHSAVDDIVRQLEEDIVLNILHPKERLVEDELMARFGVRRHVIRSALAELVHLGLVEHRKNVGALVRSFRLSEVQDLYGMRELLETGALSRIELPARPEDIERLEALQHVHDQAVMAEDPRAIFRANGDFHAAFFALCPNRVMVDSIEYYSIQTNAIRFSSAQSPEAQKRSRRDHRAMIQALKEGRRDDLVRIGREHIFPARDEYLARNQYYLQHDHRQSDQNRKG